MISMSPSSLSRAKGCFRALAFQFKARLRKRDYKGYLVLGQGVHGALAAHYLGREDALEAGRTELLKQLKKGEVTDREAQDKVIAEYERMASWYLAIAPERDKEDLLHVLAVEQKFQIEIADGIEIIGIIDIVATVRGNMAIIDTKTAASAGASYFHGAEHDAQYLLYSIAAKAKGIPIDRFGWNVLKKTKTPELIRHYIPIDWMRVENTAAELVKFARAIDTFPSDPWEILQTIPGNPGKCRSCQFVDLCTNPRFFHTFLEEDFRVSDPTEFLNNDE